MVIRYCILFLFILSFISTQGQPNNAHIEEDGNTFYLFSEPDNEKVLIFLHGGLSNPVFSDQGSAITSDFLLEGNEYFIESFRSSGYDIIMPVSSPALNWLDDPQACFEVLRSFLSKRKTYSSVLISGFSDGGTGSYMIFHSNSAFFDGLLVFNGYPQRKNFSRTVQRNGLQGKKILFFSSSSDKIIPYEFLMVEYCKQKAMSPNTYLKIVEGGHDFKVYQEQDFSLCLDILNHQHMNTNTTQQHGLVLNDELVEFYPFRKKILRKYAYGEAIYLENRAQSARRGVD